MGSNVGSYPSSAGDAVFSSGTASNYAITYATNATGLAITPRPLTLDRGQRLAHLWRCRSGDGAARQHRWRGRRPGQWRHRGFAVRFTSTATPASGVGSYDSAGADAVFSVGQATNYAIAYATNTNGLTVTPRPLTISPVAVSRQYGDANPASGGASGDNLVNGDSIASVTLGSSATSASNVGSYDSAASNAVFGAGLETNYTISYAPNAAGLVVTPRAGDADAGPGFTDLRRCQSRCSGTATGNAGGLVNGDSVASVTLASVSATAGQQRRQLRQHSASNAVFGSGLATNYTICLCARTPQVWWSRHVR